MTAKFTLIALVAALASAGASADGTRDAGQPTSATTAAGASGPVAGGDIPGAFVDAERRITGRFQAIDRDGDGALSPSEFASFYGGTGR